MKFIIYLSFFIWLLWGHTWGQEEKKGVEDELQIVKENANHELQPFVDDNKKGELVCQSPHDGTRKEEEPILPQNRLFSGLWNDWLLWKWGYQFWQFPKLPGEVYRRLLPSTSSKEAAKDLLSFKQKAIAQSTRLVQVLGGEDEAEHEATTSDNNMDPHEGMVLTLVAKQDTAYELLEVMHVELGGRAVHVNDYAYTPVISSEGELGDLETDRIPTEEMHLEEANPADAWWQWWIPRWKYKNQHFEDTFSSYRINKGAFAGGSHGQVWRGRRRCNHKNKGLQISCKEPLILKRLKVASSYRILEAGLREVHFGRWIAQQEDRYSRLFTRYVDHFFREDSEGGGKLDLWIVFADAGPSLRSYLYTGIVVGDFILYQPSALWTKLRMSVSKHAPRNSKDAKSLEPPSPNDENLHQRGSQDKHARDSRRNQSVVGGELMKSVLRSILEAAAFLHANGIVHRDIKPSNVLCKSNVTVESILNEEDPSLLHGSLPVHCVLGDLSSAWSVLADATLYTRGPTRLEQTDEYAPPEAIFGHVYNQSQGVLSPAFDSWSIGILALEMMIGSPNVFTVDQRTRAVLTHKLKKEGASEKEIQRALYLAALSQFCIYNPSNETRQYWTLRDGDPIHRLSMLKTSCTIHDFHRALRARDPLGLGFDDTADTLLHLIWQLLAWDPNDRVLAAGALGHQYFTGSTAQATADKDRKALESQMLDPRMDFNLSDAIDHFECPKCGRSFKDWNSCIQHATSRRHGKFCKYDRSTLPSCLSSHVMLPAHPYSGYCDIQGRRRVIEDFHAVRLSSAQQFYGIFDGHTGNLASKYAASFLYDKLDSRLSRTLHSDELASDWKQKVSESVLDVFAEIHEGFLKATSLVPHAFMDQSGSTATVAFVTSPAIIFASLGDSRAILSSYDDMGRFSAIQLTKDHVASDKEEKLLVEARGGKVLEMNGVSRVEGLLAITRSIGDAKLSPYLSREPHVVCFTRSEIKELCGKSDDERVPCFIVLASDGLWDMVTNQEAVDIVSEVVVNACNNCSNWRETSGLQQAAEALTLESYVRGSRDNIGVVVIAVD